MRMGFVSWNKSLAPLLIVLSLSAAGCKSGWKMPGASMFSWSRQPSAETLAGTSTTPSIETPASKYNPTAIASAAAGNSKPGAASLTSSPTTTPSSTASYSTASALPTGSPPTKPTYGGAAASANGYQTGPYGMSSMAATAGSPPTAHNTATPGSQLPGASGNTGYPSGSYVPSNVYAGTAGMPSAPTAGANGLSANNPYASLPGPPMGAATTASTGAQFTPSNALVGASLPGPSMNSTANAHTGAPINGYSMPVAPSAGVSSMPAYQPSVMPAAGTHANTTVGFPSTSAPTGYPPNGMPTATAGAMSGGYATPNIPLPGSSGGYAAAPSPAPGTLPGGSATPGAVAPAATDGYRPGTTARSTTYNFSNASSTTVPINGNSYSGTSIPLPTSTSAGSAPSTGYGSFQLPPNTAATPAQPTYR